MLAKLIVLSERVDPEHRVRNDERVSGKVTSPEFAAPGGEGVGIFSAAQKRITWPDGINDCLGVAGIGGIEFNRALPAEL